MGVYCVPSIIEISQRWQKLRSRETLYGTCFVKSKRDVL